MAATKTEEATNEFRWLLNVNLTQKTLQQKWRITNGERGGQTEMSQWRDVRVEVAEPEPEPPK